MLVITDLQVNGSEFMIMPFEWQIEIIYFSFEVKKKDFF